MFLDWRCASKSFYEGYETNFAEGITSFITFFMLYITDKLVKVNQEETTLNGLVFVDRKHSAFALHKYIEELCIWDCDMYFIRSSYMIGEKI